MAKTIILTEEQLGKVTRVDEVVGGFLDKVRASSQDAKRGYQDDKARNRRIRELRDFVTDLYVISGEKNGTMAVSKRIWQIQDIIRNHGIDYDGQQQGKNNRGKRDFQKTKDELQAWKDWFVSKGKYDQSYLGADLYNAFESCLKMPLAYERQFFYTIEKKINPLMADLSRRTGDFKYTN